ncbi:sodium transporter (plasmid) [Ralstonia syzygii]|uniref:Sodium transporter n=1 Tax=Ralstonia syzygii TaxID=28097 RepID=A0ABX7ZKW8_9RALS|nr:MHYT domain-containing protein [Ralstonia syzygii]QUP55716.1 sodium transporter [Ralstonia syzygii]
MFNGFQAVPGAVVPYSYDALLVALSYLISVSGAYVGLRWSQRLRNNHGRIDIDRLICASVALGGVAVWSMHFIGMAAYRTPVRLEFDLFMTVVSLLVVMLFAGAGLAMASRTTGNRPGNIARGGMLAGLGVAVMHYTGMAAVHTNSAFDWDPTIIALSVLIAVVVSIVALWLATSVKTRAQQLGAAVLMGVAVCGMHYTGMMAGTMICTGRTYSPSLFAIEGDNIGYVVFGLAASILMVILVIEITHRAQASRPMASGGGTR